ncbi:MAG: TIGR03936 family radical SAM-associated protein [Anaerolineales bacterium]
MRVRVTFSKQGALRYIGHLDLHKIWERSIRRAKLPLSYSQGYHPQPKIHLAAALPLGFSSRAEVMDMWLNEEVEDVTTTLQPHVPPGLTIMGASQVDDREPSLQSQVIAAEYQVEITESGSASGLNEKLASVLESESIPRVRRKKPYDLRPLIEELTSPDDNHIHMRLTAREGATGRPEEVLDAMDIPLEDTRIERTKLLFKE